MSFGDYMLIQIYDPRLSRYIIADTSAMTNSHWYSFFDEALAHTSDMRLLLHDVFDYSLASFTTKFPQYAVTEVNLSTQPYEYW